MALPGAAAFSPEAGPSVLRITKLADAEYLLRQVALGVEDYYTGSGEEPGVWQGGLAAEFGLTGVVEADHVRTLLLGPTRSPTPSCCPPAGPGP